MTRNLTLTLALLLLTATVALPMGILGVRLFDDPGSALAALTETRTLIAALNTLLLAVSVTVFTLLVGVPLGLLVGRTDLPGRSVWRAVCTTPYIIPPYITAIAWIRLLNPTSGVFNQVLATVGLGPLDIYTLPGMTLVMGLSFTPFVMLATADALTRMDASLEEQARIAGVGPWRTLLRVTLPLAAPGILTGASFVLAAAAASFGVPYLLASNTEDPAFVLTTRLYREVERLPEGLPVAVALSIVLLAVGVGLPSLARLLQGRRQYTTVTGKATRASDFALGSAKPLALAFVSTYAVFAVVIPVVTIAVTSLMVNEGRGLAWSNLTLGNYAEILWTEPDTSKALFNSTILASGAATVAVALGAVISWMRRRTTTPGRVQVQALARLPYAVPGTVLALALLLTYSQEIRVIFFERVTIALALADTLWLLGIAYLVKFLTFPVGNADSGLQAVHPSLEESARMSGAGFLRTMRRITLPLLRPQLVAAWFLVFMPAFCEVTMSILLAGPDSRVIGTALFELQEYNNPPGAAVLAMVVLVVVLGGNTALRVATRGKVGL